MYIDQYTFREKPSVCMKLMTSLWKLLAKIGTEFCMGTSMHGFKHIVVPGRHWVERLLWVGLVAGAIYAAVGVSRDQWQRYNENPTVVTLEKDFRSWRFSLPAVTACPKNRVDPAKLPEVIRRYWHVILDDERYGFYSQFVTTVANSNLLHLEGFKEYNDEDIDVDLFQLAVDVMPEPQIKKLTSDDPGGETLRWTPVMTEAGVCYTTNSLATADVVIGKADPNDTRNYPITCKYSSQSCHVMFEISAETTFYIHSPYDVMDIKTPESRVYPTLSRSTDLGIMESGCGKGIRELRPDRRGCLYIDEPTSGGRQVYSTNSCRLSCRSRFTIKLCGCRPFYYFYEDGPVCSLSGMACLARHSKELNSSDGPRCACSPQCLDVLYNQIAMKDTAWEHGPFVNRGAVKFTVHPPRTRYTREIVFHFQDLIVSFGGATGLFLGASFISVVEIFYFMLERIFGRLFRNGNHSTRLGVKETSVPFEAIRIIELSTILKDQERFNNKL